MMVVNKGFEQISKLELTGLFDAFDKKKKHIVMTTADLTWAVGEMELAFPEMGKISRKAALEWGMESRIWFWI